MTDDVALILLPTVLYRSAQVLDMAKITMAAKERQIIIGWDLCHAIGAIEMDLTQIDADFAVWCTYKYLSGGPGSTAGLYISIRNTLIVILERPVGSGIKTKHNSNLIIHLNINEMLQGGKLEHQIFYLWHH